MKYDRLPGLGYDFDGVSKEFDKKFKRTWRNAIIISIVGVLMIFVIAFAISKQIDNKRTDMKSYVGKSIVVGKDTVTIVNYSMVFQTYTLSNGMKVDEQFVNQKMK